VAPARRSWRRSGSGAGPGTLELEPRFVDVAIKRWQAFSRKDAIHAETDLTFDEVASDRTAAPAVAVAQTDVR
jgi:hypothetical protein